MSLTFVHLVSTYGYAAVALIIVLEGLGAPVPGETVLVTAASVAASGRLSLLGVIATATLAAIAGGSGGYAIGRFGGLAFVHRYGRWIRLTPERLDRGRKFFDERGAQTVFVARFIAFLRIIVGLLAGLTCMPFWRFFFFNALGGLVWSTVFGALGYAFGENLPRLHRYVGQISLALTLLAALAIALYLLGRWFAEHRQVVTTAVSDRWRRVANAPRFAAFRQRHQRTWTFIAARFERGEYLGLHLTVGLVVTLAALWLFGGITEDVVHHDPLTLFDLHVARWLRAGATPRGIHTATVISLMGSPPSMAALALIGVAVLAARRWWITLIAWLAAFIGAGFLDWSLKRIIQRPRPVGAEAFLHGDSFSFPSGHVVGSVIGFGMLAYLLIAFFAARKRDRWIIGVAASVLVALIGIARMYLGVHYFSDVVGGLAVGIVWLSVCISGAEVALGQRGLSPWEVGVERRRVPRPASTSPGSAPL